MQIKFNNPVIIFCFHFIRVDTATLTFFEVKHKEGLAEATRVFGNLSRDRDVRDFLVKNKSLSPFRCFK